MNWLDKAKKKQKELSTQLDGLSKTVSSFKFGDEDKTGSTASAPPPPQPQELPAYSRPQELPANPPPPDSSGSWKEVSVTSSAVTSPVPPTPASTTTNATSTATNATSEAPVVASHPNRPQCKLTLAQRKNFRDEFESKKPELEARLSQLFGDPWTIDVDPAYILNPKGDGVNAGIDRPGAMIYEYIDSAIRRFDYKLKEEKYGGVLPEDLRKVAPAHVLSLEIDYRTEEEEEFIEVGPHRMEVSEGRLKILIHKDRLWSNAGTAGGDLVKAITAIQRADDRFKDEFDVQTRSGMQNDWEKPVRALIREARSILNYPELEFAPDWVNIYAGLNKLAEDEDQKFLDWDWRRSWPRRVFEFYENLTSTLKDQGFKKDELLREGFKEAVDKGVVRLRFDNFNGPPYNKTVIVDGEVLITIAAGKWYSPKEVGKDLIKQI